MKGPCTCQIMCTRRPNATLLLFGYSFVKVRSRKNFATACLSARWQNTHGLQMGLFCYTELLVRASRKVHEGISVLLSTECQLPL